MAIDHKGMTARLPGSVSAPQSAARRVDAPQWRRDALLRGAVPWNAALGSQSFALDGGEMRRFAILHRCWGIHSAFAATRRKTEAVSR